MKTIIAGGRNYELCAKDYERLSDIIEDITEIVSGCCRGVDRDAELWADRLGIPVKQFPPDWNTHGRAAGPIRNRQMAEYADAVILFPGGRGTDNMALEAARAGIKVFDWRQG